MGDVVRLVLRFRDAFWGRADSSRLARRRPDGEPTFFHVPGAEFPTWWTSSPVESSALTMWAGGRAARFLLGLGRAEILRRALATLASALGVAPAVVRRNLLGAESHDWSNDPYSKGAYSFARVGGASAGRALAQPFQGTLFFAGEAITTGEAGTVTAALESGRKAARRMLR
jgi:monoamine oxidase